MQPVSRMEEIIHQVGEPEFRRVVTRSTVGLGVTAKAPGTDKWEYAQASGFLISVEGTWYLITAGHVLTAVEAKIRDGWTFGRWHLDDSPGQDRQSLVRQDGGQSSGQVKVIFPGRIAVENGIVAGNAWQTFRGGIEVSSG
jgi:hypothetical protein